MPLFLVKSPIEEIEAEAIVREADETGGKTTIRRDFTGPFRYVITAASKDSNNRSALWEALEAAAAKKCASVVLPLFQGTGSVRCRLDAAEDTISAFLQENEMTVTLVVSEPLVPDETDFRSFMPIFTPEHIAEDIEDFGIEAESDAAFSPEPEPMEMSAYSAAPRKLFAPRTRPERKNKADMAPGSSAEKKPAKKPSTKKRTHLNADTEDMFAGAAMAPQAKSDSIFREPSPQEEYPEGTDPALARLIAHMDMSFSEKLLYLIDLKGMTDVQCYKAANSNRQAFSKIRCNKYYRPSKETAIAYALSLKLTLDETNELLRTAGFTLSNSSLLDVIVTFYIERGIYDVNAVNVTLFAHDQKLLGSY